MSQIEKFAIRLLNVDCFNYPVTVHVILEQRDTCIFEARDAAYILKEPALVVYKTAHYANFNHKFCASHQSRIMVMKV